MANELVQVLGSRYRLENRGKIGQALAELKWQSSDLVEESKALRFGQMVRAEYLVTGDRSQLPGQLRLSAKIIALATGESMNRGKVATALPEDTPGRFQELARMLAMTDEERERDYAKKYHYPQYSQAGKDASS